MDPRTLAALYEELEKLGTKKPPLRERSMMGFAKVRPYVAAGAKAGLPAAVLGKMLSPERSSAHVARVMGVIGAGAGVANEALKQWAHKNKRGKLGKEILKQGEALERAQEPMRKVAAMAASSADLRRTGIGGVKRPPFATEGSKGFAEKQLTNAKKPGKFFGMAKARNLQAPGPSIKQVSPLPGG